MLLQIMFGRAGRDGHLSRVRRLMLSAVTPEMADSTGDYLAERAAKVRVVGMRGVADASLANSFPASNSAKRSAYRALYLGNDPAAYAELSLAVARLEMTPADWGRHPGAGHGCVWRP